LVKMKFSKLLVISIIFVFCITGMPLFSQIHETVPQVPPDDISPADSVFDSPLMKILQLSYIDEFEAALVILDSLIIQHPHHPAPYFFKAAIYQNWMSVYRFNKFQAELEENVQRAIEIGNELLDSSEDPWLNFYVGGAYGYRGFNRFRKYNWIGAYLDGVKGIDNFKTALEKDSTLYDVFLGLGSYYYWRTAKSKFLKLVTFWMPDKRELGLNQLEFAMNHGRYAKTEAAYALIVSLFDAKQFEKANKIVEKLIADKKFSNLIDKYYQARIAVELDHWEIIEPLFEEIFKKLENYKYQSIGFQVECRYWIAKGLSERKAYKLAFQETTKALQLSRKRDGDEEMEGVLENYKDILKSLEKLHYDLIKKLNQKSE
jgi:tetratricopeptide (TPR) repeat protein